MLTPDTGQNPCQEPSQDGFKGSSQDSEIHVPALLSLGYKLRIYDPL